MSASRTVLSIDGVRYSSPGHFAMVEADGSVAFRGRGSNAINTGGEKGVPDEVDEALKTQPAGPG